MFSSLGHSQKEYYVNARDKQHEQSSRETQLQQEILRLQKENENLRALNISLQQSIIFYISVFL